MAFFYLQLLRRALSTKFSGDVLEELTGVRYPCDLCFLPVLPALPYPNPSQSSKHSSPVAALKEQSGFSSVSASPGSSSWPSQQLGRDFQVLAVSVLLFPWLQSSPITLVWSSWIPAGCSSFLQPLTESCPSETEAVGGGFHHFCSKLHLTVLLLLSFLHSSL